MSNLYNRYKWKEAFLFDSSETEILLVQCILNEVLSYKDHNLFYFSHNLDICL